MINSLSRFVIKEQFSQRKRFYLFTFIFGLLTEHIFKTIELMLLLIKPWISQPATTVDMAGRPLGEQDSEQ